jgi:hypothetical protein
MVFVVRQVGRPVLVLNLEGKELILLAIVEERTDVFEAEEGTQLLLDPYHQGLVSFKLEEAADHGHGVLPLVDLLTCVS